MCDVPIKGLNAQLTTLVLDCSSNAPRLFSWGDKAWSVGRVSPRIFACGMLQLFTTVAGADVHTEMEVNEPTDSDSIRGYQPR